MLARKKRAAIARKRKALQPKPAEVRRISLKEFIRDRKEETRRNVFVPKYAHRSSDDKISRPQTVSCVTAKQEKLKYSGDKLVGIGLLHKSNYVPIFNHEEAVSVTRMRRN